MPTITTAVTAAAASAGPTRGASQRRNRRRRRGRFRNPIASTTRDSNPAGGSSTGATTSRSSATCDSWSTSRRHSSQVDRCRSASARFSPSAIPSAISAASSRVSSHLIGGLQRIAELEHGGSDSGLGGPQRDVLELADLLCGPPEIRGEKQDPSLLGRQVGDGASNPRPLVRRGALVRGAAGNTRLLKLVDHEVRIERLDRLHPDDVDGEVAGDREKPGGDPA